VCLPETASVKLVGRDHFAIAPFAPRTAIAAVFALLPESAIVLQGGVEASALFLSARMTAAEREVACFLVFATVTARGLATIALLLLVPTTARSTESAQMITFATATRVGMEKTALLQHALMVVTMESAFPLIAASAMRDTLDSTVPSPQCAPLVAMPEAIVVKTPRRATAFLDGRHQTALSQFALTIVRDTELA